MTIRHVEIDVGPVTVRGDLSVPPHARGMVLFAHGSGSGRHSPRNQFVARHLQAIELATLLMDLLSEDEETEDLYSGRLRFDIELLADRLLAASRWLGRQPDTAPLPLGYFGASTGAAAALVAAAHLQDRIDAVVSRGGRPDLAGPVLGSVVAPTLLIVGGRDPTVLELNQLALAQLAAPARLEVIPGATHLFEEPDALEQVAELAGMWFLTYLRPVHRPGDPAAHP